MKKQNNILSNFNSIAHRYELDINGILFTSNEENVFRLPISVVENICLDEFPINVTIIPQIDFDETDAPNLFPNIKNIGNKKALVTFYFCPAIEEVVHYFLGFPLLQETLADLLLLKTEYNPDILVNIFDGDMFHLHCSIELPSKTIRELLEETNQFYYTSADLLKESSSNLRSYLRIELGLNKNPSESAKVKYISKDDDKEFLI